MARRSRNPNGAGSITRRKDGRYHGRVYVTTTSGKRKRVSLYGQTWEDVNKLLTELRRQELQGIAQPDSDASVEEYLNYWLVEVVAGHRRPKTYQGYESVVRQHLIPGLGRKRLRRLRAQDVRVWLNRLRDECQCCRQGWDRDRSKPRCCAVGDCCGARLSVRMIQSIHAVLRNALENAVREELINRNVAKLVRVQTPKYRIGRGLTVHQARAMLHAARGDRLYSLYVLALLLGMRRGELLGLQWTCVDFDRRRLHIVSALQRVDGELRLVPTKTDHSNRTVSLPGFVVDALREHRYRQADERAAAGDTWQETGLVFTSRRGTPIEPDNLRRSWYPLRERLGLNVRFHDLRHTTVSLLLDLGVPPHVVREIVGHSDIGVTMTIYAHASLDERKSALDRLGDQLGEARD